MFGGLHGRVTRTEKTPMMNTLLQILTLMPWCG